jgi:putative membrane protein
MIRALASLCGVTVLGLAWMAPWEAVLPGPYSVWMTRHMAVVAVAAPLLAVGLAGSRLDPFCGSAGLFAPLLLSAVELAVIWGWHAPDPHAAARSSTAVAALEQGSFLAVGTSLWLASLGGGTARRWVGVCALLVTSMHMTLLGALLALTPRALHAPAAADAAAAMADQHLGGALMIGVGGLAYLVGGLALTAGLVRGDAVPAPAPVGVRAA